MSAIKSHHARLFEQLVAAYRQTLLEGMVAGLPAKKYRQHVGRIQGLDDALKLSEEADFKLNGEDVAGS